MLVAVKVSKLGDVSYLCLDSCDTNDTNDGFCGEVVVCSIAAIISFRLLLFDSNC